MTITINAQDLHAALAGVKDLTNHRSTLPILANACFTAEDGALRIFATDLDVDLSTSLDCETGAALAFTAPVKSLLDITNNLQGDLTITEDGAGWLKITAAGGVKVRIPTQPAEDYPARQEVNAPTAHTFILPAAALLRAVDKIKHAICTDDARANLTGAHLSIRDGRLSLCATDGHRLSWHSPEGQIDAVLPAAGVIVPRKALLMLAQVLDREADVVIAVGPDRICFSQGEARLTAKLIAGSYPDFTQVMPKPQDQPMHTDRKGLEDAVKFVSMFAGKTNNVQLAFAAQEIELHANDPERGETTRALLMNNPADTKVKIGVNYRYLLDALKVCEGPKVELHIIDTLSPVILYDGLRDTTHIIMPMRL